MTPLPQIWFITMVIPYMYVCLITVGKAVHPISQHFSASEKFDALFMETVVKEGDGISMGLTSTMIKFRTLDGPFIGNHCTQWVKSGYSIQWVKGGYSTRWVKSCYSIQWVKCSYSTQWVKCSYSTQWVKCSYSTQWVKCSYSTQWVKCSYSTQWVKCSYNTQLVKGG